MNKEFPVLSTISTFLIVIGWIAVLVGLGFFIIYEGIIEPTQSRYGFGSQDMIQLVTGFLVTLVGLATVALGESIKVLFAIEENSRFLISIDGNSRKTAKMIEEMNQHKKA